MIDLNEYYRGIVDADLKKHAQSAKKQQKYITESTARYHGNLVYSLYMPKIFTEGMVDYFDFIVQKIYGIFDKIIDEYMKNPEYRKLFGFDKRVEELILRSVPYECKIPISRVDIFFNEDDFSFKFCEFNTDGASAMNEDRELNNALELTSAFKTFKKRFKTRRYELFDSWVKEFTEIYKSSKMYKENANIAIVDFMYSASNNEFEIFKKAFEKSGYTCEICEIKELSYENGCLLSPSGKKIDVIYRRAVTCDIIEHYDEVIPFINAVKNNDVCLIGDFRTQIVHDKIVFKIMHDDMTKAILTKDENEFISLHVPRTYSLTERTISKYNVLNTKNKWVIKPEDSYGSKGVFAGVEFENDDDWSEKVTENSGNHYLLQEYCQPYEITNIDLTHDEKAGYKKYSNITGLFVYNGKLSGVYSRIAKNSIISTQYSEMSLPTIIVD